MRFHLPRPLRCVVTGIPFRLFVAAGILLWHIATTIAFAHDRFGLPFNAEPKSPPVFTDPAQQAYPLHDKRLVVSRWDAEHYMGLALRGYSQCPHRALVPDDMQGPICDVAFYPGYPALGWLARRLTGMPIDYALWSISLLATFAIFFLWTDPVIVDAVGVGGAYSSLLAFAVFPPAYALTSILTEACTALGMMVAFVGLARRQYALGALGSGFASAMRISGVAANAGYVLALAMAMWKEPPRSFTGWVRQLALFPLACWGTIAVFGYDSWRFGDPLLYIHGHENSFHHVGGLKAFLEAKPVQFIHAVDGSDHDLVWAGVLLLLFLIGHRKALGRFTVPAQVYAYGLIAFDYYLSATGTIDLWFMLGLARYVLVAVPIFLAVGAVLSRHPVALALWLIASSFELREVARCHYMGDLGPNGLRKCNMTQWLDW